MRVDYKLEVRGRNGKLENKPRWRRCHSLLKAWNAILFTQLGNINMAAATLLDTGGTVRQAKADTINLRANAPATTVTYGIVVGTSTQTVVITDNVLIAPVAEGGGAGQMNHLITTVQETVISGSTAYLLVQRIINNNSGAAIVIYEVGLYVQAKDNAGTTRYFCVIRDVVTGTTVPDTKALTVTYRIKAEV